MDVGELIKAIEGSSKGAFKLMIGTDGCTLYKKNVLTGEIRLLTKAESLKEACLKLW